MNNSRKLTIGLLTHDDFDGAYFTIQSIRLHHPEVLHQIEFVVVDNNPDSPQGKAIQKFANWVKEPIKYIPHSTSTGTALRNLVFEHATTPYVLCLDSHVLLAPTSLAQLIAFLDTHDTVDLLQGPMLSDNLRDVQTHMEPVWREGMWGIWAVNPIGVDPTSQPFEIPAMGMGLFVCRRDAWLGFNPKFKGFGGEECYIHEKFRQAGRKTLCLPFLRWLHRFPRPAGPSYPVRWADRIFNYLVGHAELRLDPSPVLGHFRTILPEAVIQAVLTDFSHHDSQSHRPTQR